MWIVLPLSHLIIMRNNHDANFGPSRHNRGSQSSHSETQLCVLCNERTCCKKKLSKSKNHFILRIYDNVIHFLPLTRRSDQVTITIHRCSIHDLTLTCYSFGQLPLGHTNPKDEMLCEILHQSPRPIQNNKLYGYCQSFGSILALSKMNNKYYY